MRTQFSSSSDSSQRGRESLAVERSPFWKANIRQRLPTPSGARWNKIWPRLFRLAVLAAAALLVYAAGVKPRLPDEVSLADAQTFFPDAARLAGGDRRLGGQTVVDSQGRPLGLVLTTSPHTDDIVGYAGPSNLLIALEPQQRVIGVRLLSSGDTQTHVEQVREKDAFWQQFAGWKRDTRP